MTKKGDEEFVYQEGIGIIFSVAELVGALSMAQCEWFARDIGGSSIDVVVSFEFIASPEGDELRGGINCKKGSLEHFLAQRTCLRSKIENAVNDWISRKQFQEMLGYLPDEFDDGYGDD